MKVGVLWLAPVAVVLSETDDAGELISSRSIDGVATELREHDLRVVANPLGGDLGYLLDIRRVRGPFPCLLGSVEPRWQPSAHQAAHIATQTVRQRLRSRSHSGYPPSVVGSLVGSLAGALWMALESPPHAGALRAKLTIPASALVLGMSQFSRVPVHRFVQMDTSVLGEALPCAARWSVARQEMNGPHPPVFANGSIPV